MRHNGTIAPAPKNELLRNPYFVVTTEDLSSGAQLVRVVRCSAVFLDLADIRMQYGLVISRLDRLGRTGRFLLVDLRSAPGRTDPGFEAIMTDLRPKMFAGFRRVGILTSTAGGTVQVMRHTREDGVDALICSSEAELLSFFRIAQPRR